jgi:diguanylate cyclase (GGDEF)-like protein/PAS domain S-box-containing protein
MVRVLVGLSVVVSILILTLSHEYGIGLAIPGLVVVGLWLYQRRTEAMLHESNEKLRGIFEGALDGIVLIDPQSRRYSSSNPAFSGMLGYSSDEIAQLGVEDFHPFLDFPHVAELVERIFRGEIQTSSDIPVKRKDGSIFYADLRTSQVIFGNTKYILANFHDNTERKRVEEENRNLAFYDVLTGLPNRRLLLDRIQSALSVSARSNRCGALLFLDMDKFKILNDTKGHDYGDLMLIEVGRRLQSAVREVDTVARLGGDEFVVLIEEIDESMHVACQRARLVAEKIRAALVKIYLLKEFEYHSSPSIGICMYLGNAESVDTLIKNADMAMYQVKDSGRNGILFFDPIMQLEVSARAELEADLRGAIPKGQFQLYYQLQVDGELNPIGAEVLIRWKHPWRGMVSPAVFIPAAEDSRLILDIGHWVIETACRQLAEWSQNSLLSHLNLAVNVSARQFQQPDFIAKLEEVITRHNIRSDRLKLELTEGVVLADVAEVVSKMNELKALGFRLSLDDFGTGYSSLAYLKQLPLDQLKIDQSFVRDITTDPNDAVMVKTIINMGRNFHLDVIAEGVETEAQLDFLKRNGCMAYQGYLFSKPVAIEQFEALLAKYSNGYSVSGATDTA